VAHMTPVLTLCNMLLPKTHYPKHRVICVATTEAASDQKRGEPFYVL